MDRVLELKRTPLYEVHRALGARLVPFAGWEMPVQYSGVIDEHLSVRKGAGLFDVSHMGEIVISGPGALKAVQKVATNDISKAADGQCQYTLLCYPDGGVVDDCIVYRFSSERFFICVNASNTGKAFDWINEQAGSAADVRNLSDEYAELALQGPFSVDILKPLSESDPAAVARYHFVVTKVAGIDAILSRTGYTGEDGFEIYVAPDRAVRLWESLMESGRGRGMVPVGLGARDTLRLEMGYPLYGHELSDKITPLQAGLSRFVALDKPGFIGREALAREAAEGSRNAVIGLEMIEPGVPRQGYDVMDGGVKKGVVTSGTHSPSLGRGVGMAYVDASLKGAAGREIQIAIRNKNIRARVVKTPFYKRPVKETVA